MSFTTEQALAAIQNAQDWLTDFAQDMERGEDSQRPEVMAVIERLSLVSKFICDVAPAPMPEDMSAAVLRSLSRPGGEHTHVEIDPEGSGLVGLMTDVQDLIKRVGRIERDRSETTRKLELATRVARLEARLQKIQTPEKTSVSAARLGYPSVTGRDDMDARIVRALSAAGISYQNAAAYFIHR